MRLAICLLLLSALLFAGVVALAGCGKPDALQVYRESDGRAQAAWEGAAMGFYVTSPDAQLPTGPTDTVKGGHVYWVIEATTFPTGFASPVNYQQVPAGAKDATEKHGGAAGGETLTAGTTYKFGVVSLGGQMSVEEQW
jgi:hypothetical protein